MSIHKPLTVYFVTDNKPGHKNQLLGLDQSLRLHHDVVSHWIDANDYTLSWWDVLFRRVPFECDDQPDLVVAAGSSTQKLALGLKRKYGAFLVLLMRPNLLPYSCFDTVVVPEHDNPPARVNILKTVGVLNKVRPTLSGKLSGTGLILVGGESKHYLWDSKNILSQVEKLIQQNNKISQWLVADSRRTPDDFRSALSELLKSNHNVSFCPHETTDVHWLPHQMTEVDTIWVTPDSVSMVYEALTSGKKTGVFDLESRKKGRVVQGVNKLIQTNKLMVMNNTDNTSLDTMEFCEADRVAEHILRFLKVS